MRFASFSAPGRFGRVRDASASCCTRHGSAIQFRSGRGVIAPRHLFAYLTGFASASFALVLLPNGGEGALRSPVALRELIVLKSLLGGETLMRLDSVSR